jgi:HEPN domain-containing protein
MRPPEQVKREFTRQWIQKAEDDLKAATHLLTSEEPFPDIAAFHAQQAAEKFLKAFLVWHQVEYPKTHDIGELLDLVAKVDKSLADSLREATVLTDYSVDVRYPGDNSGVSLADAQTAIELAKRVKEAILKLLPPLG